MPAKKNLAICIPSGRLVDFAFFKSFAQSIAQCMLAWNSAVITVSSPMIFENRNEIVRRAFALEAQTKGFKFDYMLWIDNDIIFGFEQIQKLISHLEAGADFISGVYFNPKDSEILPVAYLREGEGYRWLSNSQLLGKVIEVDAVGFGFCAMKMDVARKVFEKHSPRGFNLRMLENALVTEDQLFCERAKELGYKIMLDTSLIVKHVKGALPR